MSYNSFFNLEIANSDVTVTEVAASLAQIMKDDAMFWENVLIGAADTKWYEHSEDMKKVSVNFPDALLTLSGIGEESDDQWVEYHQNGKVQIERMPEWTPVPFDPDKLA